jgi:hypothetical protein
MLTDVVQVEADKVLLRLSGVVVGHFADVLSMDRAGVGECFA